MKTIDKRYWRVLIPAFFSLFFIVLIVIFISHPSDKVTVDPYRVADGWGYKIVYKNKVYINQPFVPAISGKKAFPNKRTAVKAGSIVKQRLMNKQLPSLTPEDIKKIGLDSLIKSN